MTGNDLEDGARSFSRDEERQLCSIMAADLLLLASLHAQELEPEELEDLSGCPFTRRLGLVLDSAAALKAMAMIDDGFAVCRGESAAAALEELNADFAGIYLTYQFRTSPSESVWLDDDGLERQGPMFEVRKWYRRFGVAAPDWRKRPDDHLSLQLEFVAHILRQDAPDEQSLEEAARFLDCHLLRWIDRFAARVEARCATPVYAGLAVITACYLNEMRDIIAATTGFERPEPAVAPVDGEALGTPSQSSETHVSGAGPGG